MCVLILHPLAPMLLSMTQQLVPPNALSPFLHPQQPDTGPLPTAQFPYQPQSPRGSTSANSASGLCNVSSEANTYWLRTAPSASTTMDTVPRTCLMLLFSLVKDGPSAATPPVPSSLVMSPPMAAKFGSTS